MRRVKRGVVVEKMAKKTQMRSEMVFRREPARPRMEMMWMWRWIRREKPTVEMVVKRREMTTATIIG